MSDKMLYRKSSDETEVTRGYSPSHINASEFTERLAQFNEGLNAYKKNRNINYSIGDIKAIDSNGNELSSQQSEYFKDSKVRDENGNLIPVYYGTNDAGFTEFKRTSIAWWNANSFYSNYQGCSGA